MHTSRTDSEAMLARKGNGKEAKLSYSGHVLMENRNGMVANVELLQANGTAERDAACFSRITASDVDLKQIDSLYTEIITR